MSSASDIRVLGLSAMVVRLSGLLRDGCIRIGACELRGQSGQATVEAAFALPILMLLILLLLEPGIVLYDRIVMQGAAAEGCRLLATSESGGGVVADDYIRRRLSAIPQIDQFHVHSGGCSYRIEFSGGEASSTASIRITNEIKPLPLLDFAMVLTGLANGSGNLEINVEASETVQPEWVEGSAEGRDPAGWVGI